MSNSTKCVKQAPQDCELRETGNPGVLHLPQLSARGCCVEPSVGKWELGGKWSHGADQAEIRAQGCRGGCSVSVRSGEEEVH